MTWAHGPRNRYPGDLFLSFNNGKVLVKSVVASGYVPPRGGIKNDRVLTARGQTYGGSSDYDYDHAYPAGGQPGTSSLAWPRRDLVRL